MPVEVLETPSIGRSKLISQVNVVPSWMDPFISYLRDGVLLNDHDQVRSLCLWAARYLLKNNILYKRRISAPILRCICEDEAKQVLTEVQEGVCGNHYGDQVLAHKVLRLGYYWPTIQQDLVDFARCRALSEVAFQRAHFHVKSLALRQVEHWPDRPNAK